MSSPSPRDHRICFKQGFTLIEISIVLVIIGLMLGGILVGRELIEASRIRAQINQFEQIRIAYNTFKVKYGCIAGDCNNITNFLSGTANGNGNGFVENDYADTTDRNSANREFSGEQARFFEQLSLANLIAGHYTSSEGPNVGYPTTKLNPSQGGMAVARDRFTQGDAPCTSWAQNLAYSYDCMGYGQFSVTLFIILNYPSTPSYRNKSNTYGIFTPSQTSKMDTKMDDGLPFTGNFRGANPGSSHVSTPNGYCTTTNTSSGVYNLTNNDTACHTALRLE